MKIPFAIFRRQASGKQRTGFALVVALTAIVLITVIVLAFFSKALLNRQISYTSTNQIKSDMLARTALDIVVGEVRQEIIDFSKSPTDGIYEPLTSSNMIPIRTGVATPDSDIGKYTINKVAAADTQVDPGTNGKVFGSSVSLDAKSRNGRTLSGWYSAGPRLGSAALPSWTYLSRSGNVITNATPAALQSGGADFVTGRFAYTVYNTGGLLDANVAGYPSNSPATNVGTKSSLAYADLTTLGLTLNQVDNLVTWRSGTWASTPALFDIWASGINTTNSSIAKSIATAPASGYLESASGGNAFFSRRDLLRFLDSQSAPANSAGSLTHFTRGLQGPTWKPQNITNSLGNLVPYGNQANSTSSANRELLKVKAYNGTKRTYYDDGTFEEYPITSSEPLITDRFSLRKLAWIGHNGPESSAFDPSLTSNQQEEAILDCFGLTWSPSKKRWAYKHPANGILTLDEVRDQKRMPDFFELLKAGILDGSIGGNPGVIAENINADPSDPLRLQKWEGPVGRHYETFSADKDRHLLQIGANIIDQADSNNYPTAIYFGVYPPQAGFSVSETEFNNCVFGLENLPMLQRIGLINHMVGNDTYAAGMSSVWAQPEVWNPNNSATAGASPSDPLYPTPSSLRLVTYGKVYLWNALEDPTQQYLSPPVDFGNDYENPNVAGIICFKNPGPASTTLKPFFNAPISLTGYEATSQNRYDDTASPSGPMNRQPAGTTWSSAKFLGIYFGEVIRDPRDVADGGRPQYNIVAVPDPQLTFVLEYFDGSNWHPYSMLCRLEKVHNNAGGSGSRYGQGGWGSSDGHVDPRTDRFSGSAGRVAAGNNSAWGARKSILNGVAGTVGKNDNGAGRNPIFQGWPRPSAGFIHNPLASGELGANVSGAYLFDGWLMNLDVATDINGVSRFRYRDPDGLIRPGDAWRGDLSTGDGIPSYHSDAAGVIASATRRRPVILNRPFRSVGELGYVFRDQPFKSLDFWSEKGADAGLLDLFCVSEGSANYSAGLVNINSAPPSVLQALTSAGSKQPGDTTSKISTAESVAIAQSITTDLAANGVITNNADLANRLSSPIFTSLSTLYATNVEKPFRNKGFGEAPLRALANVSTTRSWNLLIDVVAQTGKLGNNAAGLDNFTVEGEKRYWLHLAIDRFTGEILDKQLEPVYE